MRKIFLPLLILITAMFLSCTQGDPGEEGAAGPTGPTGENWLVMQFQDSVLPTAAYYSTEDTCTIQTNAGSTLGACDIITVGGTDVYRGLVSFVVSAYIPTNATVKKAYVTLHAQSTNATEIACHKATTNWTEGNACTLSPITPNGANWNTYNGVSGWTTAGGDFIASAASSVTTTAGIGYYTMELDASMVQDWVTTPANNKGVFIKAVNESVANSVNFHTKENLSSNEFNPKLTIYYTLP